MSGKTGSTAEKSTEGNSVVSSETGLPTSHGLAVVSVRSPARGLCQVLGRLGPGAGRPLVATALGGRRTLPAGIGDCGDAAFYEPVEGGHGRLEGPPHGAHHDGDVSLALEPALEALSQALALLLAIVCQKRVMETVVL